jgi:hypothetical protein
MTADIAITCATTDHIVPSLVARNTNQIMVVDLFSIHFSPLMTSLANTTGQVWLHQQVQHPVSARQAVVDGSRRSALHLQLGTCIVLFPL